MPLFRLSTDLVFPPPELSRSDGLLCIGGDLSVPRLILAYKNGIFPWFSQDDPILWWSPDPRLVLFPKQIHVSKSLKKAIRSTQYTVRVDTAFKQTIVACSRPGAKENNGTWLMDEMIEAYIELHEAGIAHSIEIWDGNTLVGGLYGLSLGLIFFGESMFSHKKNASKMALVALATHLNRHDFDVIDCQVTTDHLVSMGAREISRQTFLKIIKSSVNKPPAISPWKSGQSLSIQ